MQTENNEKFKNKTVFIMVLLSFIPIGLLFKNAEENFRKAEIKKIADRRRQRLDAEH
jgi:hypothetical protein